VVKPERKPEKRDQTQYTPKREIRRRKLICSSTATGKVKRKNRLSTVRTWSPYGRKGRRRRRHRGFSIDDKVSSIAPTQPNISHRLLWIANPLSASPLPLLHHSFVRSSLLSPVLLIVYGIRLRHTGLRWSVEIAPAGESGHLRICTCIGLRILFPTH
jgi:hypothetical protein